MQHQVTRCASLMATDPLSCHGVSCRVVMQVSLTAFDDQHVLLVDAGNDAVWRMKLADGKATLFAGGVGKVREKGLYTQGDCNET
jgi:hypothetical protein